MDRCKLCQRGGTLAAVVMAWSGGRRRSSSSRQQHRSSESPCSSTRVAPPIIITITINNSKGTQNRQTVNFLFRLFFLFFKVSQMGCAHRLYHEHSRRNVIDTSSINPLWMTTLLPTHFSPWRWHPEEFLLLNSPHRIHQSSARTRRERAERNEQHEEERDSRD